MITKPIETVFQAVAMNAGIFPAKPALMCAGRSITYAELAVRIRAVAGGLRSLGVGAGSMVGIETVSPIDHLVASIAAMAAGAVPVALPNSDPAALLAILEDSNPALIIGSGDNDGPGSESHAWPRKSIEEISLQQSPGPDPLTRAVQPEDLAMMYYTSGTSSGIRKGVMQTYGQLHNTAEYIVDITRLTGEACEFVASSIDNAFWFGRCRCVLKVGGTLLLHEGTLNPLGILNSIKQHGGNAISGDTPVFLLLMNHLEKNLRQIAPQIRWVKIASQAMPLKDKERALMLLPNAWIVMGYGLTEAMRTCLLPFSSFPDKLATDGRPCPGVALKIIGEKGETKSAMETGEILISGANLAGGYWNKEQMWKEKFDGTWYRSGDIGYLDADGFLVILGRKDQAINSGGKTIAPIEVENRLREQIVSTAFTVCGITDRKGVLGDVVALCIEGDWQEKSSWKELRIHLFECMEPTLVPKEAFRIDAFPRTINGKIQLAKLRQLIEAGTCQKL